MNAHGIVYMPDLNLYLQPNLFFELQTLIHLHDFSTRLPSKRLKHKMSKRTLLFPTLQTVPLIVYSFSVNDDHLVA